MMKQFALCKMHIAFESQILAVLAELAVTTYDEKDENKDSKLRSYKKSRTPRRIRKLNAIIQIRRRLSLGQRNTEIMKALDLPPRTFYRFLKQTYEADEKALMQQDKDLFALELTTLRERLLGSYRRLLKTASDEQICPRDRLRAEVGVCEVSIMLAKLAFEGPLMLRDFSEYIQ